MKKGIVVSVHPEDHSVDVLLADGRRLVGVQVVSQNGSTRSGTFDMPKAPERADKWDISQVTDQDQVAIVDWVDGIPVVVGFLFPQISEMTFDDVWVRLFRHQSDVIQMIDGRGNIDLLHPGGFAIRIGETPDHADPSGKNFDASLAVTRNTDRKPYIRVTMSDNKAQLTIAPDGAVTLTTESTVDVTAQGEVTVTTPAGVTIDTPETHCTGNVTVDGVLTYRSGMVGSGGSGATARIQGNVEVDGNIDATGTIWDGAGNSNHHSH